MNEYDLTTIGLSFVITWGIGLLPPLLMRYAIIRRPLSKWVSIAVCTVFWFVNIIIFTAMGSQSKTHAALYLVAFVSYWILRKEPKSAMLSEENSEVESTSPIEDDAGRESAQNETHPKIRWDSSNNLYSVQTRKYLVYYFKNFDNYKSALAFVEQNPNKTYE